VPKNQEQRSARSVGRISFEEILRSEFVEIPGMQGVCGRSKFSKEPSSEGIARRETTFKSEKDEIQETRFKRRRKGRSL
jgi:hypothetical protein